MTTSELATGSSFLLEGGPAPVEATSLAPGVNATGCMVPAEGSPLVSLGGHAQLHTYTLDPRSHENLPDRLISNSEIQTFKRCRRKWALGYVEGYNQLEQAIAGPLPFGTAIHGALEWYYGHQGDPLDWWARHSSTYDLDDKAQAKDAKLGRIMLEGYLDWVAETGCDEDLEVLSVEEFVTVPFTVILGVRVHLTGRLDVRVLRTTTGERKFVDHKTTQGLEPDPFRSEQLLMYHLLLFLRDGKLEFSGGILNKLKKVMRTERANPPFYVRDEVTHTLDDLRRFWCRLYWTIHDMLLLEERLKDTRVGSARLPHLAYPSHARSCAWECDFIRVCPMLDDGADWQGYLGDFFTKDPSNYQLRNRADWIASTS